MTGAAFDSQVGYAVESPSGTFTAPTRAIEHVKSSLNSVRPPIISKGMKAGRRTGFRSYKGAEVVKGTITHELAPVAVGMLFKQGVGAVATSGAGPFTDIYTPGPLVETQTLSVQVGTPDDAGTVNPLNFIGCQIPSFAVNVKTGEVVMIDIDFVGQHLQNTGDGDTVAGLTAATYNAAWAPFTWANAALTLNGAAFEFDDLTIKIDNGLRTDHYTTRATNPSRPKISKESDQRLFTCQLNSDLWDITAMNRAFAGTEVAFSLALTSGASSLTFAGAVRTDPFSPTIDGPGNLKQALNLTFVSATSDAAALTITQVTTDTLP